MVKSMYYFISKNFRQNEEIRKERLRKWRREK